MHFGFTLCLLRMNNVCAFNFCAVDRFPVEIAKSIAFSNRLGSWCSIPSLTGIMLTQAASRGCWALSNWQTCGEAKQN